MSIAHVKKFRVVSVDDDTNGAMESIALFDSDGSPYSGADSVGPKGDTGEAGPAGPKGDTGASGGSVRVIYSDAPAWGLLGDGSDETAKIQAMFDSVETGSSARFVFTHIYTISAPLVYPGGCEFLGAGNSRAGGGRGGGVMLQAASNPTNAALTALLVPREWNSNSTTGAAPVRFFNFYVNGNRSGNPTSDACGILLYGFWSEVRDCYIVNASKHAVLLTDTAKNGTARQTGGSENRVTHNHIQNAGDCGIRQLVLGTGANFDGYCDDNTVDTVAGSAVHLDSAGGWSVRRNHTYGVAKSGIIANSASGTVIADNYVEDFGLENSAGVIYYGISATAYSAASGAAPGGRGVHVHDNNVNTIENAGTANFVYFNVDLTGGGGTTFGSVHDNTARCTSGRFSGRSFLFTGRSATIAFEEHGNRAVNGIQPPSYVGGHYMRRKPLGVVAVPVTGEYAANYPPGSNTVSGVLSTLDTAIFVPIDVAVSQSFLALGVNITSLAAGTGLALRLGLYADRGDFLKPFGSPLYDLGTLDPTVTTGDRTLAFTSVQFQPARYWACLVLQGTAVTTGVTFSSLSGASGSLALASLGNVGSKAWQLSGIPTGALQAITTATLGRSGFAPLMGLKAA